MKETVPGATGQARISVVIACLNAEKTIERTLLSIQEQSYPNLELIVVDGLSSDRTLEIVRGFGPMVTAVISEKDRCVAEAINKGFRRATGEIFCYLNADDSFAPGALFKVAEEFKNHPEADVVTGGCHRVYADGSTAITQVPERFLRVMALRNDIEQPSTFWRASIHRKAGELDETFFLAFDWEWWNRLKTSGARFRTVTDVLSVYYFSDDNLTSNAGMRIVNEMYRVTKRYGSHGGYIADIYRFLFRFFDMKGYYDRPFMQFSLPSKLHFRFALAILSVVFGREAIDAYNWNWASKQVRGVIWYK